MKIYLDMVGCRLNQSEIESYARQFRIGGHTLTAEAESADLVVINTCAVTAAAASDSRQKIRQAWRAEAKQIIVTGCLAALNPQEVATLPGVTRVISNVEKDALVPIVLGMPVSIFEHGSILREPIPGVRQRTRAFIKVQDGCDNYCTYCITRLARGASKSRQIEGVLRDIHSALDGGAQEVVLTGVHLGSWGYDFHEPMHLENLVDAILKNSPTPRLRLSSLEPWDISESFFELWGDGRVCRHLHLPLQSGCRATLKRMGRKITPTAFAELVHRARQRIPSVAITTDIITGFPGETEDEFAESLEFVKQIGFANGHVFTYSPRPGTLAAEMGGKIPDRTARQRNASMQDVLRESASEFRCKQIGQDLVVLWEKAIPINDREWQVNGYSDNYLRVQAVSSTPYRNHIMNVRIIGATPDGLAGELDPAANRRTNNQDTL